MAFYPKVYVNIPLVMIVCHQRDTIATFYLFSQILEMNPEEEAEEDGANIDLDSQRKGKCVVLKTSTRQVNIIRSY